MFIDICSDLGEGYGNYTLANDEEILKLITSANIACGFHAGDPRTIQNTIKSAALNGTGIGAHPSFPDKVGFGRRNMDLSFEEIYTDMIYQLGAISAFAKINGCQLQHVLPHGQLSNMANENNMYAEAIVQAIYDYDSSLILMVQQGLLEQEARRRGLCVAKILFADRAYNDNGTLVSRKHPNAVIKEEKAVIERTIRMVKEKKVTSITGKEINIEGHTLLVHGDTEGSLELIKKIRHALIKEDVEIQPIGKWLHQGYQHKLFL